MPWGGFGGVQNVDFVVCEVSEGTYHRLVVPTYRPEVRYKRARCLEATGFLCVVLFEVHVVLGAFPPLFVPEVPHGKTSLFTLHQNSSHESMV
jgi:hypothetical protein